MNEKKQLIEYAIQDIVEMISKDQNVEYDEAMNFFYESEVFDKLQDVETGLYRESSAYIYDLYKDELNFGHIVQAEILCPFLAQKIGMKRNYQPHFKEKKDSLLLLEYGEEYS